VDQIDCSHEESAIGALLGSDEEDEFGIGLARCADGEVFGQGQGQWFLAEDVLAGLQGFDGDFGVPVVGCDDADDFDLFVVENFAVVFDGFGFAFTDLFVVSGAFAMVCADIADRDDITETCSRFSCDLGSWLQGYFRTRTSRVPTRRRQWFERSV